MHPSRKLSLETLGALPPAFNPDGGSVTAGNSSPINVGAAALLVMSEEKARELGQKPIAWIRSMAVAGVNPEEMGIGPVPAVGEGFGAGGPQAGPDRLHRTQRSFCRPGSGRAQAARYRRRQGQHSGRSHRDRPSLGSQRRLGSQPRCFTECATRAQSFGLATMCIGQGQGVATIFERCDN